MSDQGSQGLLSPYLRRQRIRAARDWLSGSVLDFGCGSGALADRVEAGHYTGFDIDEEALAIARSRHPEHRFVDVAPAASAFDTVVSLAVIEHARDPEAFLSQLARLARHGGRIVLTTPHPAFEIFHDMGARLGIFSRDANEEHEALLDRRALLALAAKQQLEVLRYRRFLFGANQLIVLQRQ